MKRIKKYYKFLRVIGLTVVASQAFDFFKGFSLEQQNALAALEKDAGAKIIAITQIVDHPALDATRQGIIDFLKEAGVPRHIIYENAQGNLATTVQIAQKFAGLKADVLVAISTPSAQALIKNAQGAKVVFASITDPVSAKLVSSLEKPEPGITGTTNMIPTESQFNLLQEIIPSLKRVGVIYNPGEANSAVLVEKMKKAAENLGIDLVAVASLKTSDIPSAVQNLIGKVEAIFINNDNTALSAFETIVKIGKQANLPVFSSDIDCIERGAIAVLGPNQYTLGRQTGELILSLLQAEGKVSIPIAFPKEIELHVNMKAAQEIGLPLPPSVLARALKILR